MLTTPISMLRTPSGDANAARSGNPANLANPAGDPAGFASLLRQTRAAPLPAIAAPLPPVAVASPAPNAAAQVIAGPAVNAPVHAALDAPKPTAAAPAPAAAPKPTSADAAGSDDGPADAEAPPPSDATGRARAALKGKPRGADGAAAGPAGAKPASSRAPGDAGEPSAGAATADPAQPTPAGQVVDPGMAQWLATLQRPPASAPADGASAVPARPGAGADADASASAPLGAAKGNRPADLKAESDLKAKAQLGNAGAAAPFAEMLVEERNSPLHTGPTVVTDARHDATAGIAAAGAGAMAAGVHGADGSSAAPQAVVIAAPLTAPDFAQELGLRLSVLAKDGVQTAELHLNPADMGPVSVQIVMDGNQARIDFGADMAATRQAIEAGLPELASALSDAGFTLAGGGVSQHAGGGQGGPRDGGQGGGADARQGGQWRSVAPEADTQRVATAARRIVTKGGIDLFA